MGFAILCRAHVWMAFFSALTCLGPADSQCQQRGIQHRTSIDPATKRMHHCQDMDRDPCLGSDRVRRYLPPKEEEQWKNAAPEVLVEAKVNLFSVLGSPPHASKVPTVKGIEPLEVAILVTVVVFDASKPQSSELSSFLMPHRPPMLQQCQQSQGWSHLRSPSSQLSSFSWLKAAILVTVATFGQAMLSSRVESTNSHSDRGGSHHDPDHCCRLYTS